MSWFSSKNSDSGTYSSSLSVFDNILKVQIGLDCPADYSIKARYLRNLIDLANKYIKCKVCSDKQKLALKQYQINLFEYMVLDCRGPLPSFPDVVGLELESELDIPTAPSPSPSPATWEEDQ